jgi:hypothetical protein
MFPTSPASSPCRVPRGVLKKNIPSKTNPSNKKNHSLSKPTSGAWTSSKQHADTNDGITANELANFSANKSIVSEDKLPMSMIDNASRQDDHISVNSDLSSNDYPVRLIYLSIYLFIYLFIYLLIYIPIYL